MSGRKFDIGDRCTWINQWCPFDPIMTIIMPSYGVSTSSYSFIAWTCSFFLIWSWRLRRSTGNFFPYCSSSIERTSCYNLKPSVAIIFTFGFDNGQFKLQRASTLTCYYYKLPGQIQDAPNWLSIQNQNVFSMMQSIPMCHLFCRGPISKDTFMKMKIMANWSYICLFLKLITAY